MFANQDTSTAFLIDADNLSPDAIDEAMRHLQKLGPVSIRRAYGGLEKLAGIRDVLRRHSIQGFVNQGKGTSDVALVIDAMDMLHSARLPSTVAIGSSDADFSPLAVRLREAGVRVICFAQKSKAAEELPRTYEKVIYVAALPEGIAPTLQLGGSGAGIPTSTSKPLQIVDKKPVAKKTAAKALPKKPANNGGAAKKALSTAIEIGVADILRAAPALKTGRPQPLGDVVKLLHEASVLGKSASSTRLFKKFPDMFEVSLKAPHQVRYVITSA